jgi:hypothetical protein
LRAFGLAEGAVLVEGLVEGGLGVCVVEGLLAVGQSAGCPCGKGVDRRVGGSCPSRRNAGDAVQGRSVATTGNRREGSESGSGAKQREAAPQAHRDRRLLTCHGAEPGRLATEAEALTRSVTAFCISDWKVKNGKELGWPIALDATPGSPWPSSR